MVIPEDSWTDREGIKWNVTSENRNEKKENVTSEQFHIIIAYEDDDTQTNGSILLLFLEQQLEKNVFNESSVTVLILKKL